MHTKLIKNNSGFTLMEVVVAAGIFVILGSITSLFFVQYANNWFTLTSQSDLRLTASNDILFMTQELRKANPSTILIPGAPNNNSITFDLPCDNTSTSSCCNGSPTCNNPNCPKVDSNRNTQWDTANRIQYLISNNQLQRLVNGNLSHVISTDVSSVTFEQSSKIKITLTLARLMSANRTVTVTLTGIVKLRN